MVTKSSLMRLKKDELARRCVDAGLPVCRDMLKADLVEQLLARAEQEVEVPAQPVQTVESFPQEQAVALPANLQDDEYCVRPEHTADRLMTEERQVCYMAKAKPAASRTPTLGERLRTARAAEHKPTTAPHIIGKARAGTGKTTTAIGGVQALRGQVPCNARGQALEPSPQQRQFWDALLLGKEESRSIGMVAFNKSIASELQARVPAGVQAMTMHSMGYQAIKNAIRLRPGREAVNEYRVRDILARLTGNDIRQLWRDEPELVSGVEKLVSLCKMNLLEGTPEHLSSLQRHFEIDLNGCRDRVYTLVPQVLEECRNAASDGQVDFNDMIWLPIVLDLPVTKFDLLIVDEAQDLNACQQELAFRAGRRLCFIGDDRQAIYGFAGADSRSLERLRERLAGTERGCVEIPLTVTRRCGRAIVEEARQIVPDFEAHADNSVGLVRHLSIDTYMGEVQDEDFILCRVNAPLVSHCFRFIRAGRKATIQGRDVAAGLVSLVKKLRAASVPQLVEKLDDWYNKEAEKEQQRRNPSESRLIALGDKRDCLMVFTEGANTVDEVLAAIDRVFTDAKGGQGGIKLSSIHKSKGLEARRVYLLEPEGAGVPHPMARAEWAVEQEWNLRYVAITRAVEELVYVGPSGPAVPAAEKPRG